MKNRNRIETSSIKKIGNHNKCINVSEIEADGVKIIYKKAICNAYNKTFANMSKYSGELVPLKIHNLKHCSEKFNFKVLDLKEIYKKCLGNS